MKKLWNLAFGYFLPQWQEVFFPGNLLNILDLRGKLHLVICMYICWYLGRCCFYFWGLPPKVQICWKEEAVPYFCDSV